MNIERRNPQNVVKDVQDEIAISSSFDEERAKHELESIIINLSNRNVELKDRVLFANMVAKNFCPDFYGVRKTVLQTGVEIDCFVEILCGTDEMDKLCKQIAFDSIPQETDNKVSIGHEAAALLIEINKMVNSEE